MFEPDEEFKGRVEAVLEKLRDTYAIKMIPYYWVRSPFEQGKLWRQSRTREVVQAKIDYLIYKECDFLAHCIDSVGPQNGPSVTNAIPGLSWHNFGQAVDCYWLRSGTISWDSSLDRARNGYRIYGRIMEENGLLSLGHRYGWDWVHVQKSEYTSPLKILTLKQINDKMRELYQDK